MRRPERPEMKGPIRSVLYIHNATEEEQQSMEQKIMSHMPPDFMPRVGRGCSDSRA